MSIVDLLNRYRNELYDVITILFLESDVHMRSFDDEMEPRGHAPTLFRGPQL